MGAQSTKCCCREDLFAERALEDSGRVPASLVDESFGIHNAAPLLGASHGAWSQNDEGDGAGCLAPPPPNDSDDAGFKDAPQEAPAPVKERKKSKEKKKVDPPEGKKSKETKKKDEPATDSQSITQMASIPEVQQEVIQEVAPSVPEDKVFGYPGMTLQILLDGGWVDFGADDLHQVNNHLRAAAKKFAITSRGAMYMIDMSNVNQMTQTNPSTKNSRRLRFLTESGEPLRTQEPEASGGQDQEKEAVEASQKDGDGQADARVQNQKRGCCVIS